MAAGPTKQAIRSHDYRSRSRIRDAARRARLPTTMRHRQLYVQAGATTIRFFNEYTHASNGECFPRMHMVVQPPNALPRTFTSWTWTADGAPAKDFFDTLRRDHVFDTRLIDRALHTGPQP